MERLNNQNRIPRAEKSIDLRVRNEFRIWIKSSIVLDTSIYFLNIHNNRFITEVWYCTDDSSNFLLLNADISLFISYDALINGKSTLKKTARTVAMRMTARDKMIVKKMTTKQCKPADQTVTKHKYLHLDKQWNFTNTTKMDMVTMSKS